MAHYAEDKKKITEEERKAKLAELEEQYHALAEKADAEEPYKFRPILPSRISALFDISHGAEGQTKLEDAVSSRELQLMVQYLEICGQMFGFLAQMGFPISALLAASEETLFSTKEAKEAGK